MTKRTIALGVMKLSVAQKEDNDALNTLTEAAMVEFNQVVQKMLDIEVSSFSFAAHSLTPSKQGYQALDASVGADDVCSPARGGEAGERGRGGTRLPTQQLQPRVELGQIAPLLEADAHG